MTDSRIVEIHWIDSQGRSGWHNAEDAVRDATYDEMLAVTVGYVLSEQDHSILVAGSRSGLLVADTMQIPRSCITDVREIPTPKEGK